MNPDQSNINGAAINNPALGDNLNSLLRSGGSTFFETFIPKIISVLLIFGALAFFFMFIWGAISWILSGGDKAAVESAKGRITGALIGLVILFSTFALAALVETFFGIDILTIDISNLIIQ